MILEHGDMWDIFDYTNHFIFTGNNYIKQNGALVMGRGIAREVRDRFPGVDLAIGKQVDVRTKHGFYGLILGRHIGVFQVKRHFGEAADLGLISDSAFILSDVAGRNPENRFDMNFPGIGNGHLKYNDVLPIIQNLPDNVHIWTFK